MTQREKDLFYEVLELLRKEVRTSSDFRNRDWKDADDYIFSALHLTQGDIAEIYSGRRGLVYDKSAIEGFYPVCPSYAELLRLHAAYAVGSVTLECELYKSALNDMPCIRAYSIDEGLVQLVQDNVSRCNCAQKMFPFCQLPYIFFNYCKLYSCIIFVKNCFGARLAHKKKEARAQAPQPPPVNSSRIGLERMNLAHTGQWFALSTLPPGPCPCYPTLPGQHSLRPGSRAW